MTRAEIIDRMGWRETADRSMSDIITRIERIVRAAENAEREACAKRCERVADEYVAVNGPHAAAIADECAVEIWARGETP